VAPLLEQEDRAALACASVRDDRNVVRVDQRRVLRAVDEAREIEIVAVRPARCLVGEPRDLRQLGDRVDTIARELAELFGDPHALAAPDAPASGDRQVRDSAPMLMSITGDAP